MKREKFGGTAIKMQQYLRRINAVLIRARPINDPDSGDTYEIFYVLK